MRGHYGRRIARGLLPASVPTGGPVIFLLDKPKRFGYPSLVRRKPTLTESETTMTSALILTTTLRNGRTVLAKAHGQHFSATTFANRTQAKRAADRVLVLPPISYGLNRHHIDFPGTIHIEPEVFISFCLNITKSVAYHGFEKILLVNGHGSNTPLIDLVARRTVLETNSLCAAVTYITLAIEAFNEVKETEVLAHADEFETSLYLHLAPERVQMDKAAKDDDVRGEHVSSDSIYTFPVRFNDYWGRWTEIGIHGDATKATAEKGRVIFEAAVERLVGIVDEWKAWPIAERADMHTNPTQPHIRW